MKLPKLAIADVTTIQAETLTTLQLSDQFLVYCNYVNKTLQLPNDQCWFVCHSFLAYFQGVIGEKMEMVFGL